VSPEPNRMGQFARSLGRVLRRPALLPLPLPLLRIPVGELAMHLSPGQKIRPRVALEAGYQFRYPSLEEALRACV
jgi:NAD dependent epimerase/dehydratase family enzyme